MTLRDLPSVDVLLNQTEIARRVETHGRDPILHTIREVLESARSDIRSGISAPDRSVLVDRILARMDAELRTSLQSVINATGVILHTNLGRAPVSRACLQSMTRAGERYNTLEFDLEQGERAARGGSVERQFSILTRAESALVVNNNAAAVLLTLAGLAKGREVIISRSQLVEIGGGFRVPDIMRQSGAKLVEVGTTNRTHRRDYEEAIGPRTALILRAHHSNFRIVGFAAEPSIQELAEIGRKRGIPLADDLGSGALLDTTRFGLGHEPMVQESVAAGADLVMFSGDKLLGGPQAGILIGKADLLARLRKHPLARALRADKFCLAGLDATLQHYLRGEAEREIPVWRMIAMPAAELDRRARSWAERIGTGEVMDSHSTVGGGSLPEETLPTRVLALSVPRPQDFLARMRDTTPPVIARVEKNRVLLDPRTVMESEDEDLLRILKQVLAQIGSDRKNPPG